jgi:hypothetical protein
MQISPRSPTEIEISIAAAVLARIRRWHRFGQRLADSLLFRRFHLGVHRADDTGVAGARPPGDISNEL